MDGVSVDTVIMDGTTVWRKYTGPDSPVTITASGEYTAGVDFPANIPLTICMVGGGASGTHGVFGTVLGGGAGEVLSTTLPDGVSSGPTTITIGDTAVDTDGSGTDGNPTIFYSLTAAGGVKNTNSSTGEVTTCGGTAVHGEPVTVITAMGYGGESSGFSNGGDAKYNQGNGEDGGVGSGGGVGYGSSSLRGGAGGRGEIRISW